MKKKSSNPKELEENRTRENFEQSQKDIYYLLSLQPKKKDSKLYEFANKTNSISMQAQKKRS